jgi:hypothetical protein
MKQQIYVYDLETYPNYFLYKFINVVTKEVHTFEISERRNDFKALKAFCLSGNIKYMVGFNSLAFDYPVLHRTVLTVREPLSLREMYAIVQDVIDTKYPQIKHYKVLVPQIDLFKIWHYDNVNKFTSLKWLEFAMRMENIEDLPYVPGTVLTPHQMDETDEYCLNDLDATDKFLNESIKHIQLRKALSDIYGLDLMNSSEIHISKQILLKKLSKAMRMPPYELNKLQSPRTEVKIADIIFDYIEFNDPLNQEVLRTFKNEVWRFDPRTQKPLTKIKFNRTYRNVKREFAEGGLHSFGKPGVYETNDDYLLVDVDFASYYPHLTFRNGLHPEHIDEEIFNEIYEGFYHERKKYPKSDPRNYVLKIVLNGTYGLSKDMFSFLYDPKWQLAICINGQLLLTMLSEKVMEYTGSDTTIVFENTDGAMYRIKRDQYENLQRACEEIEKICNIPLEIEICKRIIARDVNNYINIINDEKIKFKGAFEIDRDFHKNHSKRIVPIAVANYYIHGHLPVHTIEKHLEGGHYSFAKNHGIFDFCIGAKMKGKNKLYARTYKGQMSDFTYKEKVDRVIAEGWYEKDGVWNYDREWETIQATDLDNLFRSIMRSSDWIRDERLTKITRYYVSNEGVELIKKLPPLKQNTLTNTDKHKMKVDPSQVNLFDVIDDVKIDPRDRESNLEVGYVCQTMNVYDKNKKPESYDINMDYYLRECNKIINKCGKL